MMWLILIPTVLALIIFWARRGGAGEIGRRIRLSDYLALEDAIREKQEQIDTWEQEILTEKKLWRCRELQDDVADARQLQSELIALRPKYAIDKK